MNYQRGRQKEEKKNESNLKQNRMSNREKEKLI